MSLPEITITITGKRGVGKTTAAIRIYQMLSALGYKPEYKANTDYQEALFRNLVDRDIATKVPRKFIIVDDCQDEFGVTS